MILFLFEGVEQFGTIVEIDLFMCCFVSRLSIWAHRTVGQALWQAGEHARRCGRAGQAEREGVGKSMDTNRSSRFGFASAEHPN